MIEDITYVPSSLIGRDHVHVTWDKIWKTQTIKV